MEAQISNKYVEFLGKAILPVAVAVGMEHRILSFAAISSFSADDVYLVVPLPLYSRARWCLLRGILLASYEVASGSLQRSA